MHEKVIKVQIKVIFKFKNIQMTLPINTDDIEKDGKN